MRRGGDRGRVELDEGALAAPTPGVDVLAVEAAVSRRETQDPRKGEIVILRYFAGLSNAETARALGVSESTVEREWRFIRTWLGAGNARRRARLSALLVDRRSCGTGPVATIDSERERT